MPSELLSHAQLQSLTAENHGQILSDGGSVRGRVCQLKDGRLLVKFEYVYRDSKKTRTKSLGRWPEKTLAQIRETARQFKAEHAAGIDPVLSTQTQKLKARLELESEHERAREELKRLAQEAASRRTLKKAVEEWHLIELASRKDRGASAMRMLQKDVLPVLGDLSLVDVKRAQLMDILYGVVRRDARVVANHMLTDLKQFFNFAVTREWVESHPLAGVRKEKVGGRQPERKRSLSEEEITELSRRLPKARLALTTELSIWIMLSTCCRVGEISKARWQHVDFEKREWRIPAENSKNGNEHLIFLSDFALDQFRQLRVLTGAGGWCIPSRDDRNHICVKSIAKQIKDRTRTTPLAKRSKNVGVLSLAGGDWTPHDLRRTASTLMRELGVAGTVVDLCLNHMPPKLTRTYQVGEMRDQKLEAWRVLGERLEQLKLPTARPFDVVAGAQNLERQEAALAKSV